MPITRPAAPALDDLDAALGPPKPFVPPTTGQILQARAEYYRKNPKLLPKPKTSPKDLYMSNMTGFYCTPQLQSLIKRAADTLNLSLSSFIRQAITAYLNRPTRRVVHLSATTPIPKRLITMNLTIHPKVYPGLREKLNDYSRIHKVEIASLLRRASYEYACATLKIPPIPNPKGDPENYELHNAVFIDAWLDTRKGKVTPSPTTKLRK